MAMSLVSAPCTSHQQVQSSSRSRACCSAVSPSQRLMPSSSLRSRHHRRQSIRSRQVTTMGLFGLGFPELAIVGGVAVLLFGPSKLPGLGKELGKTVKSFQGAAKEFETELKNATDKDIFDEEDGLNPKPKLPKEEQKK